MLGFDPPRYQTSPYIPTSPFLTTPKYAPNFLDLVNLTPKLEPCTLRTSLKTQQPLKTHHEICVFLPKKHLSSGLHGFCGSHHLSAFAKAQQQLHEAALVGFEAHLSEPCHPPLSGGRNDQSVVGGSVCYGGLLCVAFF